MPFCPKCKCEYREGYTECADCGVPLRKRLPTEEEERAEQLRTPGSAMRQRLLMVTTDHIQTAIVVDILGQNSVVSYAQGKELGQCLEACMGYARYGDDIYVDEADYEQALSLVNELSLRGEASAGEPPEEEEYGAEFGADEKKGACEKKNKPRLWKKRTV